VDHALGPGDGSLLSATRTCATNLSGERNDLLLFLAALFVDATEPQKSIVRIAAANESLEQVPHSRMQRAVLGAEALIPDAYEILQVVLDQLFEVVGRGARAVRTTGSDGRCGSRKHGHGASSEG